MINWLDIPIRLFRKYKNVGYYFNRGRFWYLTLLGLGLIKINTLSANIDGSILTTLGPCLY